MAVFELKTWELLCYCFIFVAGLIGNLTVCLVVFKSEPLNRRFHHVPFNIYLTSLAIVDLALSVVCLPVYVMSTSSFRAHPKGTAGTILCKTLTGYLLCFLLAGVSIYLMVIISFERYTAICKPFHAVTRRASRKTSVYIAGAWCIGFLIQLPSIITITFRDSKAAVGAHCGYSGKNTLEHDIIYAILLVLQYAVPAVIFVVNFYRIQNCLTKLSGTLKRSFGDARQMAQIMKDKRKTVRIVFVVSAAFFICWTPNTVTFFIFQYGHRFGLSTMTYDKTSYQVGMVLAFFSSCINPFLYAFQSNVFRSHCKKVFKKIFGQMLARRCPRRKGPTPKAYRINSTDWHKNYSRNGYERIA